MKEIVKDLVFSFIRGLVTTFGSIIGLYAGMNLCYSIIHKDEK